MTGDYFYVGFISAFDTGPTSSSVTRNSGPLHK